jgi:hypothetical protein
MWAHHGDPFGLFAKMERETPPAAWCYSKKKEEVVKKICCMQCKDAIYENPTKAQLQFAPDLCENCDRAMEEQRKRWDDQKAKANKSVRCAFCKTEYRMIDLPDAGQCQGCNREDERLRKLEERRKNPPMCTKCKEEEDADEPAYPGLCYRCLSRQMDEETELEEEADEVERLREEAEYAAQKLAAKQKKAAAASASK